MSYKILIILCCLAIFTRFYGINWEQGYFSHPDENNMATALSQLSDKNLNPHFFAYGQFPLYLGYYSLKLVNISNTFSNSIYILRFYSAIFSLLFLFYAYYLLKTLLPAAGRENKLFIFIILLIFSPGLIQISHFGTTESLLSFVFIANLFYLIKIYDSATAGSKFIYFIISAIISGIGLGSKVTAIFFIWPIILMGFYKKQFLSTIFFILLTSFVLLASSPYNFIDINSFISSMQYESSVATGALDVFYTRQFLSTTPYLFQFTNIFPYVLGLPVFIFSIFGLFIFVKNSSPLPLGRGRLFLILTPVLIYFLYFGQLFVKWTRFMSPLFFIFPLFATIFISKFNNKIKIVLIIVCCIPGLIFFSQYFYSNPRVSTANWINQNIPKNSTILSESGNVVNLKIRPDIKVINFDFYTLDNNYDNKIELDNLLSQSNYVLIPSRRVFKNQNNNLFPYSKDYYKNIFSDKFNLIYNSLGLYENAEETFTVFDFPILRIYKPNAN